MISFKVCIIVLYNKLKYHLFNSRHLTGYKCAAKSTPFETAIVHVSSEGFPFNFGGLCKVCRDGRELLQTICLSPPNFPKMQNRADRILTFSNYEARSRVLLDELGWERLENVRLKQLAVIVYKIHNDLSPSYLRRIFTNTSNVHSHNLRNSELNCYVPRPKTESTKGSLHYRESILLNKIPSEIRNLPSLNVFKTSFHYDSW